MRRPNEMGQEVELKFLGPEDALTRLRKSPLLKRVARNRQPRTRTLVAIYYDTEKFALRKAGLSLRVRTDGSGYRQTVKRSNGTDVATRIEDIVEVPNQSPVLTAINDRDLMRQVIKVLKGAALKPLFSVEIRRTAILLTPKRGVEIEVAFDMGAIKTQDDKPARLPVCEVEFELKKGEPNDLFDCARELTADLPLTLSPHTKSGRGYRLAKDEEKAPFWADKLVLPNDLTAADAFGRIISHCLVHFLCNWTSVIEAEDPEGIHQMRVALRRMRSAFSLFGGPFRTSMYALENDVKWIAGVLGRARDLDVFLSSVYRPAAEAHGEDARMMELATVVRTHRKIAWKAVEEALTSEKFRRLALELAAVTYKKPWLDASIGGQEATRPIEAFARERVAHRYAQAIKRGKRIEELDGEERHELRIKLKKLRYAVDFFQSLFGKRKVRKYLKRLSGLQDLLGHMNDAAVARTLVRDLLAEHGEDGGSAVGYAGGVVAGWHLGHARESAKTLARDWKRFTKRRPPWA